jgi:LysR family transcriptional regulator for metE and metH
VDLELKYLRLVQAVAREGTMTRAAGQLHLTQPALSHQLADLERGLGAALFRRTSRGMVPTAAGERLLTSAEAVLNELATVRRHFGEGRARPPVLRLSTECYTCYHWLPSIIRRFRTGFAGVEVQVVVEATRKPVEALLAGKIDLALVSEAPRDRNIRTRKLFEDELVAVLSPQHPLSRNRHLAARDFRGETLFTYSVPLDHLTIFQEVLKPAGVAPARVCQVELTEAILEMVKANLGIAVLARWAVAPHLSDRVSGLPALQALPITRRGLRRDWFAATLRSPAEPPYVKAFVDLIGEGAAPFG